MVEHRMNVRRKYGLGMIVDRNRRIRPPQKSLRLRGPIVHLRVNFKIRLARIQGEAGSHLRAIHPVDLADPHRLAAIQVIR